MNSVGLEDMDAYPLVVDYLYLVAAGGVAVNKTNNIPTVMGLNPSGGRQIISKLNK